jgi:hypothetical protein
MLNVKRKCLPWQRKIGELPRMEHAACYATLPQASLPSRRRPQARRLPGMPCKYMYVFCKILGTNDTKVALLNIGDREIRGLRQAHVTWHEHAATP